MLIPNWPWVSFKVDVDKLSFMRLINAKDKHYKELGKRFALGLLNGARLIQKEAYKVCPYDPNHDPDDESKHLRGTFYTKSSRSGWNAEVGCGYAMPYAIFVHQDLRKTHGRAYNMKHALEIAAGTDLPRRPEEKAKWLEETISQLQSSGDLPTAIYRPMVSYAATYMP